MISVRVNGAALASSVMKQLKVAIYQGINEAATLVKDEMKSSLSGTISSETLRQIGHPYARRHIASGVVLPAHTHFRYPTTYIGRLPINKQTGELVNSLKVKSTSRADFIMRELFFTSPHQYVLSPGGTDRMVPRYYWVYVTKLADQILPASLQKALA